MHIHRHKLLSKGNHSPRMNGKRLKKISKQITNKRLTLLQILFNAHFQIPCLQTLVENTQTILQLIGSTYNTIKTLKKLGQKIKIRIQYTYIYMSIYAYIYTVAILNFILNPDEEETDQNTDGPTQNGGGPPTKKKKETKQRGRWNPGYQGKPVGKIKKCLGPVSQRHRANH